MYKYYLVVFLVGTFTLNSSCSWLRPNLSRSLGDTTEAEAGESLTRISEPAHVHEDEQAPVVLTETDKKIIALKCVVENFATGEEVGLYGKDTCLAKDRYLVIKTSKTGTQIATSNSRNEENKKAPDGLRTEGDVFMNGVYRVEYTHKKGEGDHKNIPWLADFLPPSKAVEEHFHGSLDTEYKIIFRLEGQYLWLYKASTDEKKIPSTERTVMSVENLYNEGKHYMVPFIGYPVTYCNSKFQETPEGKKKILKEKDCENVEPEQAKYVYIDLSKGENSYKVFEYDLKKDLYEAKYFSGRWFYAEGPIETVSLSNEVIQETDSRYTNLIEFGLETNSLSLINVSDLSEDRSDIQEEHKYTSRQIPIVWRKYEKQADEKKFGERSITDRGDPTTSRFFTISMRSISDEVVDVFVTPNYFSITYRLDFTGSHRITGVPIAKTKYQIIFYRETAVDSENFHERKWFLADSNVFGILPTAPSDVPMETAAYSEEEQNKFWRMIRFNLDNPGLNKVLWHFSENSTKDKYFRDIVKEAVAIYNQGFQYLTEGTDKKIAVELIEEESQVLGDMRYNIVNMPYKEKQIHNGLFGKAPVYVNPLTGQIIGGTANIYLDNILDAIYWRINQYVRYEIFQAGKTYSTDTETNNQYHAVTPHFREQIEEYCQEDVLAFVATHKALYNNGQGELKPSQSLDDREAGISCGKKIARDIILFVVLHEMGHSFGLAHNFKGSIDKENYYTGELDVEKYFPEFNLAKLQTDEEITKTSTVMDYINPFNVFPFTVLGKYDLEALRFLYMDQIISEGQPVLLKTSRDIEQQTKLSEHDALKGHTPEYKSCPDWETEQLLCAPYDYGATPKAIVETYIQQIRRAFNSQRYMYDINQMSAENVALKRYDDGKGKGFKPMFNNVLKIINVLYSHWVDLKIGNFRGQEEKALYTLHPEDQRDIQKAHVEAYMDTIDPYEKKEDGTYKTAQDGTKELKEGVTQEYADFYEMRSVVTQFVKELLFMEVMKCEVQDTEGETHFISINTLRDYLSRSTDQLWYVEDCFSPSMQDFLQKQRGLKLVTVTFGEGKRMSLVVSQKGRENFITYYSEHHPDFQVNLLPLIVLRKGGGLLHRERSVLGSHDYFNLLGNVASELDFLDDIRSQLETSILDDSLHFEERQLRSESYTHIVAYLLSQEDFATNPDLVIYNNRYFNSKVFSTRAEDPDSLYQQLINLVEGGFHLPEEDMTIPFFKTQYESEGYQEIKRARSPQSSGEDAALFQQYLFDLPSVLLTPDRRTIVIPAHEESGPALIYFPKYKANLERIQELDDRSQRGEELSFLEQLERRQRQSQNTFIRSVFVN